MTRDDITALRAQACRTMAALGSLLDSLESIDQTLAVPSPHAHDIDAMLIATRGGEAIADADLLAGHAIDLAAMLEAHWPKASAIAEEVGVRS